jgi:hypothetical protein
LADQKTLACCTSQSASLPIYTERKKERKRERKIAESAWKYISINRKEERNLIVSL